MNRSWRPIIIAVLLGSILLGLGACRRTLKAPIQVDPGIEPIRSQYWDSHPDDPFMAAIEKSEIHKGMSPTQVYLAWGRPLHRFKSEDKQKWIYEFSEEPETQPKTIAHLFFEREALVRWKLDRGYVYFLDSESGSGSADEFGDLPDTGSAKQPGP